MLNTMLEQMLNNYNVQNIDDKKNAIKEVIQEIVLCGLSRAGFFKHAAFYGGTALRIFHGLDRFSEDMDFSLEIDSPEFNLSDYFPILEREVRSFGLNITIEEKKKSADSAIRSAFLKGNTREHLMLFYADSDAAMRTASNEVIKIKLELDMSPPQYATLEHKYRLLPSPYEVMLYDMPSLFAGKIHAVLCRAWKNRVKGRDLYDYIFYLQKNTPVNIRHLNERLIDSEYAAPGTQYSLNEIKDLLYARFDSIDFAQAKDDIMPFIKDTSMLNLWHAEFFKQITENLRSQ